MANPFGMRVRIAVSLLAASALSLSGCGFVRDEDIGMPYRLVAVDAPGQVSLSFALPDGTTIGRIPPVVFAVGSDERFVVAQRHPLGDRSATEYYYLIRTNDMAYADRVKAVRGPFTREQFELERLELSLPGFTRIIESLR